MCRYTNRCYRCDITRHDYDIYQQQGQQVIGKLCTSSATSHLVYEKYKDDRREEINTIIDLNAKVATCKTSHELPLYKLL